MRRHLRNHTSPSRPLNTAAPYTYPLTTVPRSLHPSVSPLPSCTPMKPSVVSCGMDADSEDDELYDSDTVPHRRDLERDVEVARSAMDRMRVRSNSTSILSQHGQSLSRSPQFAPRRHTHSSTPHRPRSNSCTVPGCSCGRPRALHPSSGSQCRVSGQCLRRCLSASRRSKLKAATPGRDCLMWATADPSDLFGLAGARPPALVAGISMRDGGRGSCAPCGVEIIATDIRCPGGPGVSVAVVGARTSTWMYNHWRRVVAQQPRLMQLVMGVLVVC